MAATGRFKPMQEQVSSPGLTGRSGNHRRRLLSRRAAAYWITRRSLSSGGHSADPVAGHDDGENFDKFDDPAEQSTKRKHMSNAPHYEIDVPTFWADPYPDLARM